jgi:pimeloyl-ACP methyl ester carboxylesterase
MMVNDAPATVEKRRLSTATVILLPGMDGTGDLFRPLLDVVPATLSRRVVSYPTDRPLPYDELLVLAERQLGDNQDVVIIAESFSGPLALRLAAKLPEQIRAVVLVASFIRPPLPRWVRHVVVPMLFRAPPPAMLLLRFMLGRDAPDALVREVAAAIRRVRPEVLARRLRDVLSVDCAKELRRCRAPLLYLAAADDALVRPSSLAAFRAVRPDIQARTLPGPHLLLQAQPQAAWREIERFTRDCGVAI